MKNFLENIDWKKVTSQMQSAVAWIKKHLYLLVIAIVLFFKEMPSKFQKWNQERMEQKKQRKEFPSNCTHFFKRCHLLTFGWKDVALIIVLIAYRHGIFETIPALNEFLGIIWSIYNALFAFAVRIINTFTSNVNISGCWNALTDWFIGFLEMILQIF